jgi:hypothetical protein
VESDSSRASSKESDFDESQTVYGKQTAKQVSPYQSQYILSMNVQVIYSER